MTIPSFKNDIAILKESNDKLSEDVSAKDSEVQSATKCASRHIIEIVVLEEQLK